MSNAFTREEFYELVWSKPMTHLAKEFALSDVALHKICKKHMIPKLPLGWWAKKVAGKIVRQTPLPRPKDGFGGKIIIAESELRRESPQIAEARERARVQVTAIDADGACPIHPVVDRTVAKLRRAKPTEPAGLVSVKDAGLIETAVATTSIDRVELILNRIAAATGALGIRIDRGGTGPVFVCDDETIGFSVKESVTREKHVPTDKEKAEQAAWEKKQERRWGKSSWNGLDSYFSRPSFPEWDYHPTGQLSFELEHCYTLGSSPRRSFRDAKVQRLELMATDIAVGVVVLAAAKKGERLRREVEARQREEERQQRILALRAKHIEERRGAALDQILEELAALDRLRRLVTTLGDELVSTDQERAAELLGFARRRVADREAALSAIELEKRLGSSRLFGEDDDHNFYPPSY
jgi:hypothetical protein